jgi:hypothetical protein
MTHGSALARRTAGPQEHPRDEGTPARPGAALALLALAALALASCVYRATAVVVAMDTDVPQERPMRIVARVRSGEAATEVLHEFLRAGPGQQGGAVLPASFTVLPRSKATEDEFVTVVLEAQVGATHAGEAAFQIRRTARFRHTRRATTTIRLFLARACGNLATGCRDTAPEACTVGALCEERGLTCGDEAECVSPDVEPVPFDPETPLQDAAPHPGPDAGTLDAQPGPDASEMDTGVRPDTQPGPDACVPDCSGRGCGDDGCGGSCGTCGPVPNATAMCTAGRCGFTCAAGFGDCDGNAGNGCETDLDTSTSHCGACGRGCSPSLVCNGGTCACPAGQSLCGDVCASLGARCTTGRECAPNGVWSCNLDRVSCRAVPPYASSGTACTDKDFARCDGNGQCTCPAGTCDRGACCISCSMVCP